MTKNKAKQGSNRKETPPLIAAPPDESIRLARRSNQLQLYSLYVSIASLLVTIALTVIIFIWTTRRETAQLRVLANVSYNREMNMWITHINIKNLGPARAEKLDIQVWYNDHIGEADQSIPISIDVQSLVVCCPNPKLAVSFNSPTSMAIIESQNLNVGEARSLYANFIVPEPLNSDLQEQFLNANWDDKQAIINSQQYKDFLHNFIIQLFARGQYVAVKDSNIKVITLAPSE